MLVEHIRDIRDGLSNGRFQTEAAVSQGIVLRLLGALGWPRDDTRVVCPEFALQGRRVDFALCHPPGKARLFVEVKKVGLSNGAERQLFEYAFHAGVPVVVLTDGQEWSFFLPAELGDYTERRVYKLDLVERGSDDCAYRLDRYLRYDTVCSGAAYQAAREDYQNVSKARQVEQTLPQAWRRLLEEEDELLVELLAERTESLCGYRPDVDSVATFLRNQALPGGPTGTSPASTPTRPPGPTLRSPERQPTGSRPPVATQPGAAAAIELGFRLHGVWHECKNARDVLVSVLEALASEDPTFLDRFVALPRHGRTRRFVALNRLDLYPGRPDLAAEHSYQLRSGYWLGVNLSKAQIEQVLRLAAQVAGLTMGSELVISLGLQR